ncbi:MAG: hypothetical protein JNM18_18350 [Planctomycetaceae bacterium]|nr:hypothetical protein [Planctomycetaceae bacterium]
MKTGVAQLGSWGRVGLVLAGILLAWLVCAAVAFELFAWPGVVAASVAAVVSAVCGAVSQAIADRLQAGGQALTAMGVSMALRMGVPLSLGLFWQMRGSPLAEAGVLYYLLVYYLMTLAIETLLAVDQLWTADRSKPHKP